MRTLKNNLNCITCWGKTKQKYGGKTKLKANGKTKYKSNGKTKYKYSGKTKQRFYSKTKHEYNDNTKEKIWRKTKVKYSEVKQRKMYRDKKQIYSITKYYILMETIFDMHTNKNIICIFYVVLLDLPLRVVLPCLVSIFSSIFNLSSPQSTQK